MKPFLDHEPCGAEAHAHATNDETEEIECLGVVSFCLRPKGHSTRAWHANWDATFTWNFDQRGCPQPKPGWRLEAKVKA